MLRNSYIMLGLVYSVFGLFGGNICKTNNEQASRSNVFGRF